MIEDVLLFAAGLVVSVLAAIGAATLVLVAFDGKGWLKH